MTENNKLVVGIGDYKIGEAPYVIRTTLGSCIAICLYDDSKKIGGMLHIMLPDSSGHHEKPTFKRAKFADTGIHDLLESMKKQYTIPKDSLTAKIFGGGKVLRMVTSNIGEQNIDATKIILKQHNIRIINSKTGGDKGVQVDFFLDTGKVHCRVFGEEPEEF